MRRSTRALIVSVALFSLVAIASPARSQEVADRVATGARLFEAGELREAREVLLEAERAGARDALVYYYLGRIAFAEADYGKAADWFNKAAKADPESARYHYWVGEANGGAAMRANPLRQAILARRLRSAFERAVELDPSYVEARIEELSPWWGYLARAAVHQAERDTASYEQEQRSAILAYPDSAQPYLALALLQQQRDEYDLAFKTLESHLALHPGRANVLYQLGRLSALSGERLERGEWALREYLVLGPEEGGPGLGAAHWRLGMILEHQGRIDEARREYEVALELDPELDEAKKSLRKLGG